MKRGVLIAIIFLGLLVIAVLSWLYREQLIARVVFAPSRSSFEQGVTTRNLRPDALGTSQLPENQTNIDQIEVVVTGLDVPWELAVLPDESWLITQRSGLLLRIYPNLRTEPIEIDGVVEIGEGGLLGLALHPEFATNYLLYLYSTTQVDAGLLNRVEQYRFDVATNQLSDRQVILADIPGAQFHDGGRIAFGPDGYLYIATGDATDPELAQSVESLAGSILRINPDGTAPVDNLFENRVYSMGHRNPQGLAWDSQGRLWSSEHGPSGARSGFDEINLIKNGGNYGWPIIEGDQQAPELTSPILQSGADETWAPGDATIYQDTLFWPGLRGQALYSAKITADGRLDNPKVHFEGEFGRLRTAVVDGNSLLLLTSNQDGRGEADQEGDKVIRVPLKLLTER